MKEKRIIRIDIRKRGSSKTSSKNKSWEKNEINEEINQKISIWNKKKEEAFEFSRRWQKRASTAVKK
jgi:hypothetical protein